MEINDKKKENILSFNFIFMTLGSYIQYIKNNNKLSLYCTNMTLYERKFYFTL